MRFQTAINKYSKHISNGGKFKNAPFLVKWRIRFSTLGWFSLTTWKIKYYDWILPRKIEKLSPEKRERLKKILNDILSDS